MLARLSNGSKVQAVRDAVVVKPFSWRLGCARTRPSFSQSRLRARRHARLQKRRSGYVVAVVVALVGKRRLMDLEVSFAILGPS